MSRPFRCASKNLLLPARSAAETPGFRRLGQECVGLSFHRLRRQGVVSRDFPVVERLRIGIDPGPDPSGDGSREAAEHRGQGRGGHGRHLETSEVTNILLLSAKGVALSIAIVLQDKVISMFFHETLRFLNACLRHLQPRQ